ncbi:unnamed protein product [Chrysoparadoxa australica]
MEAISGVLGALRPDNSSMPKNKSIILGDEEETSPLRERKKADEDESAQGTEEAGLLSGRPRKSKGMQAMEISYDPKNVGGKEREEGIGVSVGSCCCKGLKVVLLICVVLFGAVYAKVLIDRTKHVATRKKLLNFLHESHLQLVTEGIATGAAMSHPREESKREGSCPLVYSLEAEKAKKHGLVLFDEELELLGTALVRVCKCVCSFQVPALPQDANHGNALRGGTGSEGQSDPGDDQGQEPDRGSGGDGTRRVLKLCSQDDATLNEMFMGANLVMEGDGGWYYDWFLRMDEAYQRTSSHYSSKQTYGVPEGAVLRTLLTGLDPFQNTWFQLEGANWNLLRHPIDSIAHAINYIEYKVGGVQIGPMGTSKHTDSNPLRVTFDGCVDKPGQEPPGSGHRLLTWTP